MPAGRNDPCPCGSGAKYKRCCLSKELELDQLVASLERTVQELGEATWAVEPDWFLDRIAEFYDGGAEGFGALGPDPAELLAAELWFLLDCPLPDGQTPLWRLGHDAPSRSAELLGRSELRAWRVESIGGARALGALCPLGSGRVRIELCSEPVGELERGAFVVARSVPLGPQRWALIGPVAVVDRSVAADFDALLAALDAPLGELWRVHGGVLARSAWAWPERRECTLEGDIVEATIAQFDVRDRAALADALDADGEFVRGGVVDGWAERWRWSWDPPAAAEPPQLAGARYELAREEAAAEPHLAELDLGLSGDELWLSALTPARFNLAERLLRERLGSLLGEARTLQVEQRSATPRWRALMLERSMLRIAPAAAVVRSAA